MHFNKILLYIDMFNLIIILWKNVHERAVVMGRKKGRASRAAARGANL